ncbi:polyadenylate-specific 3'-exoribonuclease AS [Saccharothrix violaceirubra]|uniref:3'-5' exoribonuclease Rv2179c-like domain-containing protein n=1 Tax=Saccharothrix violaceirubra TaxID=413306 RepID=A0A7W7T0L3_9PSEU|nr:3'-5' exoribonuclease [Saccharothrix violaceirubra]MBB4963822.1 hypothetical protein [Saccharothrix violaceirubra]
MRYWYDTEFLEDGRTIDLISIGIVAEDGREYYAVNEDATYGKLNRRIRRHQWLMDNVVPGLPKPHGDRILHMPDRWLFDYHAPEVKPHHRIADEVRDFLLATDSPVLWADYGAYDHVVLCQLWGPMVDLPKGLPMFTRDIQQEAARLGIGWDELPQQESGHHNALADARHCRLRWRYLDEVRSAEGTR